MKLEGCTALITGASAGIGREFARQLAGHAGALVLVARRANRLQELHDELASHHPSLKVQIRRADLSRAEEVSALAEWIEGEKIAIDLLINNAGLGDRGPFATSDPERLEDMLQVNMVALTTLTHRLLPPMLTRRHGAILNVSSCASFLPLPGLGVYAATKAYVTSFSEALKTELRGSGVSVTALCPGPVHTEFDQVARRPTDPNQRTAPEVAYVAADEVVRAALKGLLREKPIVIPGVAMKLAMLIVRLTPIPLLRLAGRASA